MPSVSRWRVASDRAIAKALADGKAAGETGVALRARVDAAYPFGQRKYLPYRMWLEQRRTAFAVAGLLTEGERAHLERFGARARRYGQHHRATMKLEADWKAAVDSGLISPK